MSNKTGIKQNLKESFIGGIRYVLRIFTTAAAVLSLFIPFSVFKTDVPAFNFEFKISLPGVFSLADNENMPVIKNLAKSVLFADTVETASYITAMFILLSLVTLVIVFFFLFSFADVYSSSKIAAVFSFGAAALSLFIFVFELMANGISSFPSFVIFKIGFGAPAAFAALTANGFVNLAIRKKKRKEEGFTDE